ncbi:hypothetical protein EPA93_29665 [Ktedonosporobacter rubrisoli]|uniref:Uncharacterized protein n=1 Tax=Ktedonosporobacter rubrisoli TaxID=2509675 RepID=A0A4P6JWT0_KTERU|nr:SIR2 family protein [Ktedonosporobacter rubrisoli]QBD79925.1 hypothetical protein EPA93_29665 [Ktedonosporobacter rubrisoli]
MKETDITGIADMLGARRSGNKRTVLILGAHAGAFFENMGLYEHVSKYSMRSFERLSVLEKFEECFKILRDRFNESDVDTLLRVAVKDEKSLVAREEDDCVAELVKEGYFELIISTNIDTILEGALRQAKMQEPYDYSVFNVGRDSGSPAMRTRPKYGLLLKLFGDLGSRQYTLIKEEFDLATDRELKDYLEEVLCGDVLIVGYDPVWDEPLERAISISERSRDIIFVGEDLPPISSNMIKALQRRKGSYLVGRDGSYATFMRKLHRQILNRLPISYEAMSKIGNRLRNIEGKVQKLEEQIEVLKEQNEALKEGQTEILRMLNAMQVNHKEFLEQKEFQKEGQNKILEALNSIYVEQKKLNDSVNIIYNGHKEPINEKSELRAEQKNLGDDVQA